MNKCYRKSYSGKSYGCSQNFESLTVCHRIFLSNSLRVRLQGRRQTEVEGILPRILYRGVWASQALGLLDRLNRHAKPDKSRRRTPHLRFARLPGTSVIHDSCWKDLVQSIGADRAKYLST